MSSNINDKFKKIETYLIKITNDFDKGVFVFQVGFPEKWFYKSNEHVECQKIANIEQEGESAGFIIEIFPKKEDIYIEEVVNFIVKTVETNNRIAEMEELFMEKMKTEKQKMLKEVEEFSSQIENFRMSSFDDLNNDENIEFNLNKIKKVGEEFGKVVDESKENKPLEKNNNDLKNIDPDDIDKKTDNK
jgi:hypothetical protein